MKLIRIVLFIAVIMITGCKTQKETVQKEKINSPKKEKAISEEERQKMLQKEYKPEEHAKPITADEENNLDALAGDLANYTCKKEAVRKMIESGEITGTDQLTDLDEIISKIYDKARSVANDPVRWDLFEKKYNQYLQECSG
ncbi:MAG: hypothetical protein FJY07_13850 [Bacteroidetes bacterium]|nr:hypothetical protein [Bacteroidota bacterium]